MHIYFGHTGVHLLPFVEAWPRPCIVSFHGMDVRDRAEHPGYLVKLKKLLQTVPLVLARSNSLAARLRELDCPPDKIRINRTGIPLNAFPFVERTPPIDGGWKIVQACRLVEKKGLPHTVNAFARFSKKFPNASLTIAGEGPLLSKLEDLAQSLGVRERIHFTGFLNQNQLFDLYSSSHIFMHPSHCVMGHDQEGIPNSMLEAMATGLPVVATFHGGIPEAITNKESGLLVEEKDVDGLTRALVDLASQPDLAEAIGKCGSQVVHSEFEHAAQVEKLETFYDEAWTHGR
jgi:colanic acid/amylovoran biosynthesis glycosyltransferase